MIPCDNKPAPKCKNTNKGGGYDYGCTYKKKKICYDNDLDMQPDYYDAGDECVRCVREVIPYKSDRDIGCWKTKPVCVLADGVTEPGPGEKGYKCAPACTVEVLGTDAIYIAGRADLAPVPDPSLAWVLARHSGGQELLETFPKSLSITAGDVLRVLEATGEVDYFQNNPPPIPPGYGPEGNGVSGSNLDSLGGISGYIGPQGPLVGVFLDDSIPNGVAPAALDFTVLGTVLDTLSPDLGQVFYIGDGTSTSGLKEFVAPPGTTRVFFGIPDGFGFGGQPGAYDDNDGSFEITVNLACPW